MQILAARLGIVTGKGERMLLSCASQYVPPGLIGCLCCVAHQTWRPFAGNRCTRVKRTGCSGDGACSTHSTLSRRVRTIISSPTRSVCLITVSLYIPAGIIFTDLAELLGTAIAFHLCVPPRRLPILHVLIVPAFSLIPKLPLYAGVLLTSLDVFIVLIAFNSYPSEKRNRSITAFEVLISCLVLTVLGSFIVLIVKLSPDWGDLFEGYLPSSTVVSGGALYVSVGIVGATVMPHALFLGSKLATIERMGDHEHDYKGRTASSAKPVSSSDHLGIELAALPEMRHRSPTAPSLHMPQPVPMPSFPLSPASKESRSAKFIRTHLHHAQLDIATSLFCFALVVNSAILIVASAAFYYGAGAEDVTGVQEGNLFSAHALIKSRVGEGEIAYPVLQAACC